MLCFIVLFLSASVVADFDFIKALSGEWEVTVEEMEIEEDEDSVYYHGFLNLTYSIESASMVGGKLKLETEEDELLAFKVNIESEGDLTGSFDLYPISPEEDDIEMEIEDYTDEEEREEDAYEVPLVFETNQLSFHESKSIYSVGENEGGVAIFTIISANAWTMTLIDNEKKVISYAAKRVNIPTSSWLVRFGPMIMMFAILVVPRLLGNALKPNVPQIPQQLPNAGVPDGARPKEE